MEQYYQQQAAGSPAAGFGYRQKGHGLGALLSLARFGLPLLRTALPYLKTAGKFLGRELFHQGLNVAGDVLAGEKPKRAIQRRAKQGAKNVVKRAASRVQKGGGGRKRRASKKRSKPAKRGRRSRCATALSI